MEMLYQRYHLRLNQSNMMGLLSLLSTIVLCIAIGNVVLLSMTNTTKNTFIGENPDLVDHRQTMQDPSNMPRVVPEDINMQKDRLEDSNMNINTIVEDYTWTETTYIILTSVYMMSFVTFIGKFDFFFHLYSFVCSKDSSLKVLLELCFATLSIFVLSGEYTLKVQRTFIGIFTLNYFCMSLKICFFLYIKYYQVTQLSIFSNNTISIIKIRKIYSMAYRRL